MISNLNSQIQAHELLIDEKEAYSNDIKDIRRRQKNNEELMNSFRRRKKENENVPNKYCEGVAKILEEQVKKILLDYNYTFSCAEGKQALIDKKNQEEKELDDAKKRLAAL